MDLSHALLTVFEGRSDRPFRPTWKIEPLVDERSVVEESARLDTREALDASLQQKHPLRLLPDFEWVGVCPHDVGEDPIADEIALDGHLEEVRLRLEPRKVSDLIFLAGVGSGTVASTEERPPAELAWEIALDVPGPLVDAELCSTGPGQNSPLPWSRMKSKFRQEEAMVP